MRSLKFRALVTIDPSAEEEWDRESPTRPLAVRAHQHEPERLRSFNAMVSTEDQEPLRPGDTYHLVTLTVTDEEAMEFLTPGEHFELWEHHKVGHGVISRRVVI
ncbi:hypothetical protein [Actinoallomurus sp. NPDC052274]|uniref:hypothetical protein n=1 Tax=Actinoallomurus sp. NPDC052274 TaxID=3155420 RepID=UPI0034146062